MEDRYAKNISALRKMMPEATGKLIVPDRIMLCRFAQRMIAAERLARVTSDPAQLPEPDALHLRMRNLMMVASDAEVIKIFHTYRVLHARRKIKTGVIK